MLFKSSKEEQSEVSVWISEQFKYILIAGRAQLQKKSSQIQAERGRSHGDKGVAWT